MEKKYEWMEDMDMDSITDLFKAMEGSANAPKTRHRELTAEEIWDSPDSVYIMGETALHEMAKREWGDLWR